jgi:soluble lytic murein transglycosylase-like protein
MEHLITKFFLVAALAAVSSAPMAETADANASAPETAASHDDAQAIDSHKLNLANPADYRLNVSSEYRLQGPWGKPAAPEITPPIVKQPPQMDLPFHDEVLAAAHTSGLDPALIHAVIRVESDYNATAVSPKGAVGLMQLMPETARRYGVKNSKDPAENIRGGTEYLIDLKRMFGGDLRLVLAAYNAGENAVLRYGRAIPRFPETLQYIPRVLAEYERLRSLLPW